MLFFRMPADPGAANFGTVANGEQQVEEWFGQKATRAWLGMAAIFAAIAVVGLLMHWDGLTRSGIIACSMTLIAGLLAIAVGLAKVVRR
jgi:hypothetical protein